MGPLTYAGETCSLSQPVWQEPFQFSVHLSIQSLGQTQTVAKVCALTVHHAPLAIPLQVLLQMITK